MSFRLIALDMDGTLLNPEGRLTKRTINALRAAGSHGAAVVLASGRMPCALRSYVGTLGITAPLICYNGALIADAQTEKPLAQQPIDAQLGREIAAFCEQNALHIQAYAGDSFVCECENEFSIDYTRFLDCPVRMRATGEKLSRCLDFDTPKMLGIAEPERVRVLLPLLREHFAGRAVISTSQPKFIEFVSPRAGKGAALETLCSLLSIPRESVIAFGDGLNDLDMIEWAGTGCVMANGADAVKACANLIAPSNAEDGVAQIIEALLRDNRIGKE